MTRREFLATAAAVAGATGVGHTQTPRFRISLAQWSLHRSLEAREIDHLDFVRIARRDYAIEAVEYVNTFFKDKATLQALWTPARLNDGNTAGFSAFINGYAVGWPTVERSQHRAIISAGGARAVVAIYPEDELTVVILTNLLGASPVQFVDELAGLYIPALRASQAVAGK